MATKGMKGIKDVAPLAGAWIEIFPVLVLRSSPAVSLPSRERGLKLFPILTDEFGTTVAPLAGAWIEIRIGHKVPIRSTSRSPRGSVD